MTNSIILEDRLLELSGNSDTQGSWFVLPRIVKALVCDLGSAMSKKNSNCSLGDISVDVLVLIVEFAYFDRELTPIQGALVKTIKDAFSEYGGIICPEAKDFFRFMQCDLSMFPESNLRNFGFNEKGQVVYRDVYVDSTFSPYNTPLVFIARK
jgi:hypothetical protein